MTYEERESLATYLRSLAIDNFRFDGGNVRIGRLVWNARRCKCAGAQCDGWELEPVSGVVAHHFEAH